MSFPKIIYALPELDPDTSGYTAGVQYKDGATCIRFPGVHTSALAAAERAHKISGALMAAGEMGQAGHVGWSGERPAGMPRNGVEVGR